MLKMMLTFFLFMFCFSLSGCTKEGKIDQSLESLVFQSVKQATTPHAKHHRLTNAPGSFVGTVIGKLEGDHWDKNGKRYTPHLSLRCDKRQTFVMLLFQSPIMPTTPLQEKVPFGVGLLIDKKERLIIPTKKHINTYSLESADNVSLVRRLAHAETVSLVAKTLDDKTLIAHFDMKGLHTKIAEHDFYCANAWLTAP